MAKTKFAIEPGAKVTKAVMVFIETEAGMVPWGDKHVVARRYHGGNTRTAEMWIQKLPERLKPFMSRFPSANGGRGYGRWLFDLPGLDGLLDKNRLRREGRK